MNFADNTTTNLKKNQTHNQIKESIEKNDLVVIIGSGISVALTNGSNPSLSWPGLIKDGLNYAYQKGKITETRAQHWGEMLSSDDLDELLSAAEFVTRKLDGPSGELYARWLSNTLKLIHPENNDFIAALKTIQAANIPICTLNYDSLLEQVTGLPSIRLSDTAKVTSWIRKEEQGILHLHGVFNHPNECILGIRDYETTLGDDVRNLIQRCLSTFKRLLFIGCGDTFGDPNFTALIGWTNKHLRAATPQHYALVRETEVDRRHRDSSWHGFVEPLSYGENFDDLPRFLSNLFQNSIAARPSRRPKRKTTSEVKQKHEHLINGYRAFLVKDCGQMTIEGVRADMDTAQRCFDLERLFVPLKVASCPPDIPETDPEKDEKLKKWLEEYSEPRSFGQVFGSKRRLALLALPGGGKSILLKRLAVAYAENGRRNSSTDELPDEPLLPVLIRCREWRDSIRRPILTLLKNLPDVTGQPHLEGFVDAIVPLLREGRILFLVDGLDEIHDDGDRATFVENLEKFLTEYEKNPVVITSREAGFSLIAPTLSRICERWRVAELEDDAIGLLCDYWHRLMSNDSPEAQKESQELSQRIRRSAALRRLAGNPLLLTMLLVVKHGHGRLPPDRVSLYARAVEVLLDTWNIKGHEALNPKEAVPQLAYVAFRLMAEGKQTATERELLTLLEEAREKNRHIRRYAKDTPYEFLKRVELRSSLVVEAGHVIDGGKTVPFYQFRHLTFQEYLAAVAAIEGHYINYTNADTILTPLAEHLTAEEWKEVIPMAAVLAKKQAAPLIAELVSKARQLRETIATSKDPDKSSKKLILNGRSPAPIAQLVKCFAEEAEVETESLDEALGLIAYFLRPEFVSTQDFQDLARGPYSEELFHQIWRIYSKLEWGTHNGMFNSYGTLAYIRHPKEHWRSDAGKREIHQLLNSESHEDISLGIFTVVGMWHSRVTKPTESIDPLLIAKLEELALDDHPPIWAAAAWALGLICYYCNNAKQATFRVSVRVLDRMLDKWLMGAKGPETSHAILRPETSRATLLIYPHFGIERDYWCPSLTDEQALRLRELRDLRATKKNPLLNHYNRVVATLVAFHAKTVCDDGELKKWLKQIQNSKPQSPLRSFSIQPLLEAISK